MAKISQKLWKKVPEHLRPCKDWPQDTVSRIESLVKEYEIFDPAGLVLLQAFGRAEDRELKAREQIETEGQVVQDRFGQAKGHPLLPVERDARAAKLQALKALSLEIGDEEPAKVGRPSTTI